MSLFRRPEYRDAAGWAALRDFATGGASLLDSGMKSALTLVPLYAATGMIADSISILPMAGFETDNGIRRRMTPQPRICISPHVNPVFTRVEWLHQFSTSFLLRGNAYGAVTKIDDRLVPEKIAWLHPDHVEVDETTRTPGYFYNGKELDLATVVHVPWYPVPGCITGLSPVGQFRAQLETNAGAVRFGNSWFRRGGQPSGHLKYGAGPLDPQQSHVAKERFRAAVDGNDLFVSGNDWDWKQIAVSAADAQFLQTMKAGANQIAAIYRVNPEDIGGEAGSSLTYATVELNQIKFQIRALQPIFTRLEHHVSRFFQPGSYIKFNPDSLVRTDLKTRMEAHEISLRTGMETQVEGRALEDKAPLTPAEINEWQKLYGKTAAPPKEARDHA